MPTTHSNLDGSISAKFHIRIGSQLYSTATSRQRGSASSYRNPAFQARLTLAGSMTRISILALPLLLYLVPLATTLTAWHFVRRLTPPLPSFRIACFRCGIVTSVLSLLVTMTCWIDPFPLIHTPDGGYSIAWLELAWRMAISTAMFSIILALFGRSWPRI